MTPGLHPRLADNTVFGSAPAHRQEQHRYDHVPTHLISPALQAPIWHGGQRIMLDNSGDLDN